jgi:hypothetical protein
VILNIKPDVDSLREVVLRRRELEATITERCADLLDEIQVLQDAINHRCVDLQGELKVAAEFEDVLRSRIVNALEDYRRFREQELIAGRKCPNASTPPWLQVKTLRAVRILDEALVPDCYKVVKIDEKAIQKTENQVPGTEVTSKLSLSVLSAKL